MKISYVNGNRTKFIKQIKQGEIFIGSSPFENGVAYIKTDNNDQQDIHTAVNLETGEYLTRTIPDNMQFQTVIGELTIFE